MRWMLKNSKGVRDSMLTFAVVGLAACVFAVVASSIDVFTFRGTSFKFAQPDTSLVLGLLGATVTAYVVRRNKKDDIDGKE